MKKKYVRFKFDTSHQKKFFSYQNQLFMCVHFSYKSFVKKCHFLTFENQIFFSNHETKKMHLPLAPLLSKSSGYIVGTVASGSVPAFLVNTNDDWYQTLEKPSWNPPSYIFPIVWTVLNIMIGTSASLAVPGNKPALDAFLLNRVLSISWTPVFFVNKNLGGATFLSRVLIVSTVYMMKTFSHSGLAVRLLVPYLAWLICASALASRIEKLNTYWELR